MNNAVVCINVEKWFGAGETRIQVLRKLDLTIKMSELAMLVGPSGCGKTTLISVITGLLDPTDGEVEVLEERPNEMAP
jgi:putative ABC transport system ATP-binding protein